MDNFLTLEQGIAKFNELTKEYGKDLISYNWDAGHAYSQLDSDNEGGTKLSMLSSEMSILPDVEQDQFFDHINEWLSDHDDCPPCVPSGECECSDINDIDTLKGFKSAYEKINSVELMSRCHNDINELINKIELDGAVDEELGA